jgi:hypothetical protein
VRPSSVSDSAKAFAAGANAGASQYPGVKGTCPAFHHRIHTLSNGSPTSMGTTLPASRSRSKWKPALRTIRTRRNAVDQPGCVSP